MGLKDCLYKFAERLEQRQKREERKKYLMDTLPELTQRAVNLRTLDAKKGLRYMRKAMKVRKELIQDFHITGRNPFYFHRVDPMVDLVVSAYS